MISSVIALSGRLYMYVHTFKTKSNSLVSITLYRFPWLNPSPPKKFHCINKVSTIHKVSITGVLELLQQTFTFSERNISRKVVNSSNTRVYARINHTRGRLNRIDVKRWTCINVEDSVEELCRFDHQWCRLKEIHGASSSRDARPRGSISVCPRGHRPANNHFSKASSWPTVRCQSSALPRDHLFKIGNESSSHGDVVIACRVRASTDLFLGYFDFSGPHDTCVEQCNTFLEVFRALKLI